MDIEEEICMECPQGMSDIGKDVCIILIKYIYRLVQAIRQYCKKAIKILKNSGFIGGNVNPWLYIKKSAKDTVFVALYLDDNLIVDNIKPIDNAIANLKNNELLLKIMEGLQDYLSQEIKFS